MSDNDTSLPPPHSMLRKAPKSLYKLHMGVHGDSHLSEQDKSYAQVESLGSPHGGSPNSDGGLKPGRKRRYRVMARVSKGEHEAVIAKAKASNLSLNEFVRIAVLGPAYVSSLDPEKRRLLLNLERELGRQGNNLNQIAKHLNAGTATPLQGDSMLAIIGRGLLSAHNAVRQALAEGRVEA